MARIRKNKEVKEIEIVTNEVIEPVEEKAEVKKQEVKSGKDYVVALGTPSFYVIKLEDGTMKTIQGSNTYKRGDIVRL